MAKNMAIISVLEQDSMSILMQEVGAKPSSPVVEDLDSALYAELEPWGTDNLEPQHLVKDAKSNATLNSSLHWIVRALYSGGLQYGYAEQDGEEERFIPQKLPKIDAFLGMSNYKRQLIVAFQSLKITSNCFPELILTKDRSMVAMLQYNDASYCRWGKAGADGRPRECLVSANWEYHLGRFHDGLITVPALDDTFSELEALKNGNSFKYMLPNVNYPTLGNRYYAEPTWNPLRTSGWLAYANQIPKFKENYLKNSTHIKYAVHIPQSWWKWKYPTFDTIKPEDQSALIRKEHERFDKFLRGIENAGKSLLLTFRDDPNMIQQGYTKWDIQVIDKKVVDGVLGNDLLDITQMTYQAVGVDSTLLGGAPGSSKIGAGSGSDKREAYNLFMGLSTLEQDIVMRPFELAAAYNGYPDLKFRLRKRMATTLNEVTPSKRQVQEA